MTHDEFLQHFPKSSPATLRANGFEDTGAPAVTQSGLWNDALAEAPVEKRNRGRFFVLVTSVRSRLLDEDNLCEKFHVDLLRYAGILPSDAPDKTSIKTTQRKAQKGEAEHTQIEVTYIES